MQKVKIMTQFVKQKYQEIVVTLQRDFESRREVRLRLGIKRAFCTRLALTLSLSKQTTSKYEYQKYHHSRIGIAHLDSMQRRRKTGESYGQGW